MSSLRVTSDLSTPLWSRDGYRVGVNEVSALTLRPTLHLRDRVQRVPNECGEGGGRIRPEYSLKTKYGNSDHLRRRHAVAYGSDDP